MFSDTRHNINKSIKNKNVTKNKDSKQITLDTFFKSKEGKLDSIKIKKNDTSSYSTDFKSECFSKSNSLQSVQSTINYVNKSMFSSKKDCKELLNFSMIIDSFEDDSDSKNISENRFDNCIGSNCKETNNYYNFLSNTTIESRIQPVEYLEDVEKELLSQIDKNPYEDIVILQKDCSDMRKTLIEWALIFQMNLKFRHETLFLTIYIFDKILKITTNKHSIANFNQSNRINNFRISDLNYLMKTCLFLSAKYEEVDLPEYDDYFNYESGNENLNKIEVLKLEYNILSKLDFNLCFTSVYKFTMFLSLKIDDIFFKEKFVLSMMHYYNFHKEKLSNFTIKNISYAMFFINFYINTYSINGNCYDTFQNEFYLIEQKILNEMNISIKDFCFGLLIWSKLNNIDLSLDNFSKTESLFENLIGLKVLDKEKPKKPSIETSNLFERISLSNFTEVKRISNNFENISDNIVDIEQKQEIKLRKNSKFISHTIKVLKDHKFLEELSQIKLFTKMILIELIKDIRRYENCLDTNESSDIIQILFLDLLKIENSKVIDINLLFENALINKEVLITRTNKCIQTHKDIVDKITISKEMNYVDTFKNLIEN